MTMMTRSCTSIVASSSHLSERALLRPLHDDDGDVDGDDDDDDDDDHDHDNGDGDDDQYCDYDDDGDVGGDAPRC